MVNILNGHIGIIGLKKNRLRPTDFSALAALDSYPNNAFPNEK